MLLDRAFAAVYDRVLAPSEHAGLSEMRARVLSGLDGTVVEIGAGTGLNLAHYPATVEQLVQVEPVEPVAVKLRERVERQPRSDFDIVIEDWTAAAMALPDASIDHVVSTMVMCTVDDLEQVAGELARILRPGGSVRLIEHIGPSDGLLGATQRTIEPAWKVGARGCRLTRDPRNELRDAGFDISAIEETTIPAPKLLRRAIAGAAIRP